MELASLQSDSAFQVGGGSAFSVCVGVGVFSTSILDIKVVGRTSRGYTGGRSHRISHPPSFCGACLNFLARRIQQFLPSLTGKSNIVYERFNRSPPVGHFISF